MRNLLLALLAGILVPATLGAAAQSPYPNEIKGLELYARYLAPLQPGQSYAAQVAQVFGSDQGLDLKDWKITALYSCIEAPEVCDHGIGGDRLFSLELTPKQRVSLLHLKFPSVFERRYGGGYNGGWDVYLDKYGLEYWVASRDLPGYKKGDLLKIDYGFKRKAE